MVKIINKILLKLKIILYLKILIKTPFYFYFYKSFLISKYLKKKSKIKKKNYLTIIPNPGAGIGHQLANYNAAIWFSKKFSLNHIHYDFSLEKWNKYFRFDLTSENSNKLFNKGYKKIKLPRFNEKNLKEVNTIKKIISFYNCQKTIFFLEHNQSYKKQFETQKELKYKFFFINRNNHKLIYNKKNFNIAIHIRLGDILLNKNIKNKRLLNINYYINAINYIKKLRTSKKKMIYIFSNGSSKHYDKLFKFKNIFDIKNLSDLNTFNHFINSNLLVISRSSFSYKAGLISNNIKLAPINFWHDYPKDKKWKIINE